MNDKKIVILYGLAAFVSLLEIVAVLVGFLMLRIWDHESWQDYMLCIVLLGSFSTKILTAALDALKR